MLRSSGARLSESDQHPIDILRWSERKLGPPSHCAPLEQRSQILEYRHPIGVRYRSSGANIRAGLIRRFIVHQYLTESYTHVAPLGLGLLDMSPVYKHAAPLGLQKKGKRESGADSRLLYTLRSPGAKSWVFLDLSCINPILHTCRPSINMPPRWG